jgi:hypothetical protein
MKKYIIIFPNTIPNSSSKFCMTMDKILADSVNECISYGFLSVPLNWPFLVINFEDIDETFWNAYEPDFSNPTSYGKNEKMQKHFVNIGHIDNWNN